MGSFISTSASGDSDGNYTSQVFLNVYDLTPLNNYMYWFGCGIFHSGIEVHGSEYGYGAHDFPTSGVFEVEPKRCPGFIYRCSISLGNINMPPSEFRAFMENLASDYHGDTYHLISKNCNHFADDVSLRLTGRGIPGWVNRLALLGALCSCLLPESLQQSSVKQMLEYHVYSEDGSEPLSIATCEPTESDDADHDKLLLSPSSSGDVAFIKEVHRGKLRKALENLGGRGFEILGIGGNVFLAIPVLHSNAHCTNRFLDSSVKKVLRGDGSFGIVGHTLKVTGSTEGRNH